MIRLHYAGYDARAQGFGWATANSYLVRELSKRCELTSTPQPLNDSTSFDVVFQPLINHNFDPASPARGKINLAYTFFEFELGPNAANNAKKYDVVFAGSSWCVDRMRERGIMNGELLIQGVDSAVFHPHEDRSSKIEDGQSTNSDLQSPRQFRIFSGGKFEWRKGQDLVIAAFKKFAETHPGAHLVCSWFNPWPDLITSMCNSEHIDLPVGGRSRTPFVQQNYFGGLLCYNGLAGSDFTILPQLSQTDLAREMRNTDVGLFPNRCEGGTNLVLMEYLSCGKPAVANILTGHADIAEAIQYQIPARYDSMKWADQSVDDIVATLEHAYAARSSLATGHWPLVTWKEAANTILATAEAKLEARESPLPRQS